MFGLGGGGRLGRFRQPESLTVVVVVVVVVMVVMAGRLVRNGFAFGAAQR